MPLRLLAKARRRESVIAAEGSSEMGTAAVAHPPCHLSNRDPLSRQELGGGSHAPRDHLLLEGALTELRKGALQLTRRAAKHPRDRRQREILALVVTRDEHSRK